MKIKCPSCGLEEDYSDYISFKNHCRDSHPRDSLREYAKQTFKIHEKIASIEKLEKESEDYRNPPPPICNSKVKQELKSLLDDDDSRYLPASANKGFESLENEK